MNQMVSPPRMDLVPETAPFSSEQREWLNGFLAALIEATGQPAAPGAGPADAQAGDGDDGEAPWHDQTIPIDERMKLAEGRPLRRRMMAAMAQQDCGQCGYNCNDYAEALFAKSEDRLNLCVPGGKETARMLKALHEEIGSAPAAKPAAASAGATATPTGDPGRSRDNPVEATFLSRRRLNKDGSEKETWHLEFDLTECGLDYVVGDSFGIFPRNDGDLVEAIMRALGAPPDYPIGGKTLRQVLTDDVSLSPAPDSLFQLFSYITGGDLRQKAQNLSSGEDPDGDAETLDVLATLDKFANVKPGPEAFVEALEPLQPRLYSISSSNKATPGKISLTVDAVRYAIGARTRLGVASTFLAARIKPGDKLRVYVQKAHDFALPGDSHVPIIMVGPGTGIAPFLAFLHDRAAVKAPGRNWLFFGHQRSDYDFFYDDELNAMKKSGLLTRLSLAWSRDGGEKFYVQDRMRSAGRELWSWIADGAHIYVCGDAKRMAQGCGARAGRYRRRIRRTFPRRGRRFRCRSEKERPLPAGRLLTLRHPTENRRKARSCNDQHRATAEYDPNHLCLLRRRLRHSGNARWDGRRGDRRRPGPSGQFRAAVFKRLGARRNAGARTAPPAPNAGRAERLCAHRLGQRARSPGLRLRQHHRAARPGFGRGLFVRPIAQRRLLCREQADERLRRIGQCRHQFAALHGLIRRRSSPRLWRRYRARSL